MCLEAIAVLLGHRSLEMTLVYARIADPVVADEYASVCEQIDKLYATAAAPGRQGGAGTARPFRYLDNARSLQALHPDIAPKKRPT